MTQNASASEKKDLAAVSSDASTATPSSGAPSGTWFSRRNKSASDAGANTATATGKAQHYNAVPTAKELGASSLSHSLLPSWHKKPKREPSSAQNALMPDTSSSSISTDNNNNNTNNKTAAAATEQEQAAWAARSAERLAMLEDAQCYAYACLVAVLLPYQAAPESEANSHDIAHGGEREGQRAADQTDDMIDMQPIPGTPSNTTAHAIPTAGSAGGAASTLVASSSLSSLASSSSSSSSPLAESDPLLSQSSSQSPSHEEHVVAKLELTHSTPKGVPLIDATRNARSLAVVSDNKFSRRFLDGLCERLKLPRGTHAGVQQVLSDRTLTPELCAAMLLHPDKPHIPWVVCQDLVEFSIQSGEYDSRARVLLRKVAAALSVAWPSMVEYEDMMASDLLRVRTLTPEEEAEREARAKKQKMRKWALMGLAAVGGGVLIGLTAGLAAPLIAAGAGAVVGTSGAAFLASAGGVALVGTLFGAAGAGLTGFKMKTRIGGLKEFAFAPISTGGRMHVVITVTGWLATEEATYQAPWASLDDVGEQYTVEWEHQKLVDLGKALSNLIKDQVVGYAAQQILLHTALAGMLVALAWPAALVSAAGLIDNPWAVATNRAEECGIALANALQARLQGCRPVSLIGFSLGARAILKCLEELASRKVPIHGLIEDVYLFGAAVPGDPLQWQLAKSVVAGRFVNGYSRGDWLLTFLYRAASAQLSIAGIAPVEVEGIENVDLSDLIVSHTKYPEQMHKVLARVGLNTSPVQAGPSESDDVGSATMPPAAASETSAVGEASAALPDPSSTAELSMPSRAPPVTPLAAETPASASQEPTRAPDLPPL
ncbi:hypothetical protein CAOG_04552 [Capsaspora owczarzaki ATCC 30864]|uniref:Transmembrane and coiled-coil domain-containing protein 4 n=1 Tax=Capsaspora owczarzaki (strain ATCC 30864) TaxID=595528 RepID=A0A0D2WQA7_CAPO3|nr:hypothetical protein CAOG_04552 [Capsaspora owczarzaki ATCC 30864]KJE93810.1 hypothetical protein, variant [Capsaspora owczarzaki ATCC 30864]|eukprot:XP_004347299.1 hypothetical protein CAOG_04552 [Capsaspora owczarzaki ATCC 30864]